ncbi:hypothetical protein C1X89_29055 [Pseudomonas sp. GP01-A8]|nr:hypothetical protein C1X90_01420 [Pseudomonas sp. GP01-A9]PMU30851.1 hypothetical protein C1X88_08260 [Pseudomonas sp. GP01-A13]PMU33236.1 hypothetical protein C1X89_29055 [Pseudomonas sp. GP01-A8]PMU47153.1 hypothetical protein C1X87_23360 [Pseudomonas sp. GP01-A14]PMU58015.1 hypothetical protein C1X85_00105 [Pseudomonas sp. GP01-A6]PMU67430.1 hypothetical protein C1X84_30090 [Pseudomonas sp. GP01-A1]PMU79811.1 hypothetical protein C1X81_00810 [Pseudomonas sp. FW215-L2]PMU85356.1 hypothe
MRRRGGCVPARSNNANQNVGAGLLANAECQSPDVLTDPPHSRASPLPHWFFVSSVIAVSGPATA